MTIVEIRTNRATEWDNARFSEYKWIFRKKKLKNWNVFKINTQKQIYVKFTTMTQILIHTTAITRYYPN